MGTNFRAEGGDTDQTEPAGDLGHQRAATVAPAGPSTAFGVAAGADHAALQPPGPPGSAAALTPDWQLDVLESSCLRCVCPNPTVAAGDGRGTGVCLAGSRQADGDNGVREGDISAQLQQREVPATLPGVCVLRMVDDLLDKVALLAGISRADVQITQRHLDLAGCSEVFSAVRRRQHVAFVDDAAAAEGSGAATQHQTGLPRELASCGGRAAHDSGLTQATVAAA